MKLLHHLFSVALSCGNECELRGLSGKIKGYFRQAYGPLLAGDDRCLSYYDRHRKLNEIAGPLNFIKLNSRPEIWFDKFDEISMDGFF